MKRQIAPQTFGQYTMRLARAEDAEAYYQQNFAPMDPEVARFTGCQPAFTREEVLKAFFAHLTDETRYDFLLEDTQGRIVGESVINEIDWDLRKANFRICIFHPEDRGQGLGAWVVRKTRDIAFGVLKLHRLELDVFSFNPRAERAYQAAGFVREGVLRDAVRDAATGEYGDDILMAMLESQWRPEA